MARPRKNILRKATNLKLDARLVRAAKNCVADSETIESLSSLTEGLLKEEGRKRQFWPPADASPVELPLAGRDWWRFFRFAGMPHLCFHSTRVSVVTRMARAGVPISQAMRYVGHASPTIHAVYQRLSADDVGQAVAAVRV